MGFSPGAAALLIAAPQLPELQAMGLRVNFADLQSEIVYQSAPFLSFIWLAQRSVMMRYFLISGYRLDQNCPIDRYTTPPPLDLLLIHEEYEGERTQAELQWQKAKLSGA